MGLWLLSAQEAIRRQPGSTQEAEEAPRSHPGDTQEAPRSHPEIPRSHPEGTQEAPRTPQGATKASRGVLEGICCNFIVFSVGSGITDRSAAEGRRWVSLFAINSINFEMPHRSDRPLTHITGRKRNRQNPYTV